MAGPNASKKADETERTKWIEVLAAMSSCTPISTGTLLALQASNMQPLGAGPQRSGDECAR